MYKNIYYEKRRNKIHVWDDKRGHLIVPYKKYAYVKNAAGYHHTLDGDKVKKVYQWDDDDPNLFESEAERQSNTAERQSNTTERQSNTAEQHGKLHYTTSYTTQQATLHYCKGR